MNPGATAASAPDRPAVIMTDSGGGEVLTYGRLEERSTRLANAFRAAGLRRGDVVALLSENSPRFAEVYWACLRSGLYLTPLNWHLAAPELTYILRDCGAAALVASERLADAVPTGPDDQPTLITRVVIGGEKGGFEEYERLLADASPVAPADQPRGTDLLYSSGTTGRPKGVKLTLPEKQFTDEPELSVLAFTIAYSLTPTTLYYSPAPLYHAAPLRFMLFTHSGGGTVVVAPNFDAETALRDIERHGITHSQWVPTHFVRMLKLPAEVRTRYDLSTHTTAIHAAAPCPVEVKRQMIDWWGPILYEYYASTEGAGATMVTSQEWLEHPGSVGRPVLGTVRICADDGSELPVGETGLVYFERDVVPFHYHNDQEKSRGAQHPKHETWTTVGDVGRVDADGYLYLTDRKAFMIISGGVNIYPQEIEDCFLQHPAVLDVAVVGLPDAEFGESVLAVVQLTPDHEPTEDTRTSLLAFARERLAGFKVPRRIEFSDALPRTPTGKLIKRVLQTRYA